MKLKAPKWAWILATGLGSGRMRPAPGTWGSLVGLGIWCLLSRMLLTPFVVWVIGRQSSNVNGYLTYYILIVELLIIVFILLAIWLAIFVSNLVVNEVEEKDPGYIVIDEWVGMWIALWPVRWEIASNGYCSLSVGWIFAVIAIPFLAFRLLDIFKPWPIRQIQVLPCGYGIVVDDVVAGLYSLPIVALLTPFFMYVTNSQRLHWY